MTRAPACPVCGKPAPSRAQNRSFPFCSDRCRLVDLGRWLGEEYRVQGARPGNGSEAAPSGPCADAEDE